MHHFQKRHSNCFDIPDQYLELLGLKMMRLLLKIMLFLQCLLISSALSAATRHPLNEIRQLAEEYVRAHMQQENNEVLVESNKLDPRLNLASCTIPLKARLPYAARLSNSIIVSVSCDGEQPWSLHVPVNIRIFKEIAVTARPMAQGETLDETGVEMQRREVSRLGGGYILQEDKAIGFVTRRPLQMGQPLLSTYLKAPTVIKRGQKITLLAKLDNFEVRSTGEALMDGAVGDRIKARNRHSKRVVEGIVTRNATIYVY